MSISGASISVVTLAGAIAIAGFYFGRSASRLKLPSLIGYMVLGLVAGPSMFNVLTEDAVDTLGFVTDIALGFVAFSIGTELSIPGLRHLGTAIIFIILSESFLAFIAVAVGIYALTRDLPMALIFGAMAPASAPAGTVAVIQECKARGTLTKALYAVVGFDDGLAIIIFGFAAAAARSLLIAEATGAGERILPSLLEPAAEIGLCVLVGGVIGLLFCSLVRKLHTAHDMFIVTFGAVLIATGLALRWHLSLILLNMIVGFVVVNTRREALVNRIMSPVLGIMPLLFILFFCLAGAHLKIDALPALGTVGIVYILSRSAGLMGGAWLGAVLGRAEEKLRKYVGMGILSQAGVAIGLSLIVDREFEELSHTYDFEHAAYIGTSVLTTITATSIFFELVGPILTKIALGRAGEINTASPEHSSSS